jgi:hypothetical protein
LKGLMSVDRVGADGQKPNSELPEACVCVPELGQLVLSDGPKVEAVEQ